jgi:hypothetical protein
MLIIFEPIIETGSNNDIVLSSVKERFKIPVHITLSGGA